MCDNLVKNHQTIHLRLAFFVYMLISVSIKVKTTTIQIVEKKGTHFLKLISEVARSLFCRPLSGLLHEHCISLLGKIVKRIIVNKLSVRGWIMSVKNEKPSLFLVFRPSKFTS